MLNHVLCLLPLVGSVIFGHLHHLAAILLLPLARRAVVGQQGEGLCLVVRRLLNSVHCRGWSVPEVSKDEFPYKALPQ